MRTKTKKRGKVKRLPEIVEDDLLCKVMDHTPVKLVATAKLFERWAEQLRRMAVLKSNELPSEARN